VSNRKPAIVFIFITLVIDILGFGLIIPVLPGLVKTLTTGGPERGAHEFGLLLASFGLAQFLFSPILGALSDRYGRRPVLLIALFVTIFDYVIMALANSMGWLFVGRILAGMTGASFTVGSAYIADVSPPEKRAQSFGLIGAAFGVGFILGPAAGGLLATVSERAPFWAAAALSLANFLFGLFVFPESLQPKDRRAIDASSLNPAKGLVILLRFPWVAVMAAAMALTALAQNSLQSTWVLFTTARYHWSPLDNGLSLALIGLCSGLVQGGLTRLIIPRLGERRSVIVGYLVNFLGFLGFVLATKSWMVLVVLVFWCLGGISGPALQSMLSKQFQANEQGALQGALTSIQSLTGIVGPLIATWVFGYFTSPTAPIQMPAAPFALGAVLIAVSALVASKAMLSHRDDEIAAGEAKREVAPAE
jgi:DHA1 family tetracycline resistance protein-like MFS transporter